MTVQVGPLCRTGSELKLLVFSRTDSINILSVCHFIVISYVMWMIKIARKTVNGYCFLRNVVDKQKYNVLVVEAGTYCVADVVSL